MIELVNATFSDGVVLVRGVGQVHGAGVHRAGRGEGEIGAGAPGWKIDLTSRRCVACTSVGTRRPGQRGRARRYRATGWHMQFQSAAIEVGVQTGQVGSPIR